MILVLTILLASPASVTYSQETKSTREDAATAEARKEAVDKMRSFLADVKVYDVDGEGYQQPVPLVDHPVLICQDVEPRYHQGSVWVWGEKGRPRAIFEGYWKSPANLSEWPENVIHSLSLTPIVAEGRSGYEWQPRFPAFELKRLDGATKPADNSASRRRQIKNLATKFTACEFWDNQRNELRLLAHPVHEYRDESAKILDGALFGFVHGASNTEAILLIEASVTEPEQSEWRFGFVRMGHAELHAYFDGREVWNQPLQVRAVGSRTSPYVSIVAQALLGK
jgi:hypothetical protein